MMDFLAIGKEMLALLIALACFLLPIVILFIIVIVKFVIKSFQKSNQPKIVDQKVKYLALFGEDNIIAISKEMTRVKIEVKDLDVVDYDGLREMGVGVLITGNTIKCSSSEFAALIE